MPAYRSRTTTHGRNMAGARGLWRATGMKNEDFGKPIIAVVNSFTQFVPGHVHLKDMGQLVAREIEKHGGVAKEFNTIAIDDGIAMGHDGMLYSLPSREIIADSVEYMVNAHCADAIVCISNCDKITPGMLMAALRLNIPVIFVSGGPMEAGKTKLASHGLDLVDAMVIAADSDASDEKVAEYERSACPTCGSCSGMFTANSMNCLMEALGLALPGNGSTLATHSDREQLFLQAGRTAIELCKRYYGENDESVLPRNIANFKAFENAMSLDIAMGGSTNTILHLLAAAQEAEARARQEERENAEAARTEERQQAEAAAAERERAHEAELAAERERAAEAQRQADEAAERERERIASEQTAAAERARLEKDRARRTAVMSEAKLAIMSCGVDEETARKVVLAIMAGEVPRTFLDFAAEPVATTKKED